MVEGSNNCFLNMPASQRLFKVLPNARKQVCETVFFVPPRLITHSYVRCIAFRFEGVELP